MCARWHRFADSCFALRIMQASCLVISEEWTLIKVTEEKTNIIRIKFIFVAFKNVINVKYRIMRNTMTAAITAPNTKHAIAIPATSPTQNVHTHNTHKWKHTKSSLVSMIQLSHEEYIQYQSTLLEAIQLKFKIANRRSHYNQKKYSFSVRITNVWNSLPLSSLPLR